MTTSLTAPMTHDNLKPWSNLSTHRVKIIQLRATTTCTLYMQTHTVCLYHRYEQTLSINHKHSIFYCDTDKSTLPPLPDIRWSTEHFLFVTSYLQHTKKKNHTFCACLSTSYSLQSWQCHVVQDSTFYKMYFGFESCLNFAKWFWGEGGVLKKKVSQKVGWKKKIHSIVTRFTVEGKGVKKWDNQKGVVQCCFVLCVIFMCQHRWTMCYVNFCQMLAWLCNFKLINAKTDQCLETCHLFVKILSSASLFVHYIIHKHTWSNIKAQSKSWTFEK